MATPGGSPGRNVRPKIAGGDGMNVDGSGATTSGTAGAPVISLLGIPGHPHAPPPAAVNPPTVTTPTAAQAGVPSTTATIYPNPATQAIPNLIAFLNDEEINGDYYVSSEQGEVEDLDNKRIIFFKASYPRATKPMERVIFTSAQANDFIITNAQYAYAFDSRVGIDLAFKIAFLRYIAARAGLVSPAFTTTVHNVKYSEVHELTGNENVNLPRQFFDSTTVNINTVLPAHVRKFLMENFGNIVCTVAYMFRVRGHHFLPDMNERYAAIWQKCLKVGDHPGVTWDFIAHNAIHAIYPDILDDFYNVLQLNGNVAGALIKRFHSSAAGTAAIRAVLVGARDLAASMPGFIHNLKPVMDELLNLEAQIKTNRWAGSINRKYYGAPALVYDESKFGTIGAVVIGALGAFAPDSPLLNSPALKRIANNARITGGIITRGIVTASTDPGIVKNMLYITNPEEKGSMET